MLFGLSSHYSEEHLYKKGSWYRLVPVFERYISPTCYKLFTNYPLKFRQIRCSNCSGVTVLMRSGVPSFSTSFFTERVDARS